MSQRTLKPKPSARAVRCAIYTRKSTEEGLQQEFNSLDAQRESGEAYVASQKNEGWECLAEHYDDGGYSGGDMDRPALTRLLADIEAGKIDCVVVYKVDRLSRSLMDFARMMEVFDKHKVAFVSVTQQFNTTTSMGRLILNVLLSFAQFEREIISERTRDKIAAARRKGRWSGGRPILGYDVVDTKLVVNEAEASRIRQIFQLYLDHEALLPVVKELARRGWNNKEWTTKKKVVRSGRVINRATLYQMLVNPTYIGKIKYKEEVNPGLHQAIVDSEVFAQVQAVLGRNRLTGGAEVRNKHGALLRGILFCGHCDCAMSHSFSAKGTRRYRYYVCTSAQKNGRDTCPYPSVSAGEIESFVVDEIRAIGRDPDVVAETLRQANEQIQAEINRLEAEQRALGRELRRHYAELKDAAAVGSGVAPRLADLNERIRSAEERLAATGRELAALAGQRVDPAEAKAALAEFDPIWAALTCREQERLLRLLIERVEFDGEQVAISLHPTGLRALSNQIDARRSA